MKKKKKKDVRLTRTISKENTWNLKRKGLFKNWFLLQQKIVDRTPNLSLEGFELKICGLWQIVFFFSFSSGTPHFMYSRQICGVCKKKRKKKKKFLPRDIQNSFLVKTEI